MLLLFETAAGYALFKVLNKGKIETTADFSADFDSLEKAQEVVKLKAFSKFENTTEALAGAAALTDSKLSKGLKKFLKKNAAADELAVLDAKLGGLIKEKLGIQCIWSNGVMELARGVRSQLQALVSGLAGADLTPMSLGLSHSLSRYKLKFSPDKVDTMIVQAIGLLDDLDKELNTYAMRVREWYGWHFPEMTRVVTDNLQYAKTVQLMRTRDRAAGLDFSEVLSEEVESEMKEAAAISMGTDISESDILNILALCEQVVALSEYRAQLYDYLKSRMAAIAPNLTVLVGELVGARLIAHAGSLMNLAKYPASTVQILGAEKALFRALKTKHETPKYGLIYHASLIGQASPKNKGKMSRVLAAKCALSIRVDAMGDSPEPTIGLESRQMLEARARQLEGRELGSGAAQARGKADLQRYDRDRQGANPALLTVQQAYNPDADITADVRPDVVKEKKKKKKREEEAAAAVQEADAEAEADVEAEAPPKKKKKKATANGAAEALPDGLTNGTAEKKKKKTQRYFTEAEDAAAAPAQNGPSDPAADKPQKKKKKKVAAE